MAVQASGCLLQILAIQSRQDNVFGDYSSYPFSLLYRNGEIVRNDRWVKWNGQFESFEDVPTAGVVIDAIHVYFPAFDLAPGEN